MKTIELTKGRTAIVDRDWFEMLSYVDWRCSSKGYVIREDIIDGMPVLQQLHRLILNVSDSKNLVDHINGNPLDNREINLRKCNNQQNCSNRGKQANNTSGYKGVTWNKKVSKWKAQIMYMRDSIYLGTFTCKHEAAKAYNKAARKYHKEFAYQNIIKEK